MVGKFRAKIRANYLRAVIVLMEKETNQDTIKPLSWEDFTGNNFGLPYQRDNISTATTITYDISSDHGKLVKQLSIRRRIK